MKDYEILDHTADFCVRVTGDDLKSVFVKAAWAMFDIIAPECNIPPTAIQRTFPVNLTVDTKEKTELLVVWLSHLLFLSESQGAIFTEFVMEKLNDGCLTAQVAGYPRKYFSLEREIKAVTYHGLKIFQENNQLKSEIIFDV